MDPVSISLKFQSLAVRYNGGHSVTRYKSSQNPVDRTQISAFRNEIGHTIDLSFRVTTIIFQLYVTEVQPTRNSRPALRHSDVCLIMIPESSGEHRCCEVIERNHILCALEEREVTLSLPLREIQRPPLHLDQFLMLLNDAVIS
jgi:hypothetical protein